MHGLENYLKYTWLGPLYLNFTKSDLAWPWNTYIMKLPNYLLTLKRGQNTGLIARKPVLGVPDKAS